MPTLDYGTPEPRRKLAAAYLLIGAIFVAHSLGLFLLYKTNEPDFVRFALPTFVAFCLNVLVVPKIKFWIAAALTLFSFWAGMIAALNTYGS
jgi:hypothetical protein